MSGNGTQKLATLPGVGSQAADQIRELQKVVYRLSSRIAALESGIQQSQVVGLKEALDSKVPVTRIIWTQSPLTGGRDLRADLTIRDIAGSGSGTVTSVGLSGPSGIGISGSPVIAAGTLSWSMPTGWVAGDLLIGDGSNSVDRLPIGTNGYVLTVSGGAPAWVASSGSVNFVGAETPAGSTGTSFTLAHAPNPAAFLMLVWDGLVRAPAGVDYTLAGTSITTVSSVDPSASNMRAWYVY
jgi:hypothetical protein